MPRRARTSLLESVAPLDRTGGRLPGRLPEESHSESCGLLGRRSWGSRLVLVGTAGVVAAHGLVPGKLFRSEQGAGLEMRTEMNPPELGPEPSDPVERL